MSITPEQLHTIFTENCSFSQLGFSMLITRMKGVYTKDPTPYTLQSCTREVNSFLSKYSATMPKDCAVLAQL